MSSSEAVRSRAGRKRINDEAMSARFPAGTFARIDDLLEPKEKRADFIRAAVEREIGRRNAGKASA